MGDDFLAMALILDVETSAERSERCSRRSTGDRRRVGRRPAAAPRAAPGRPALRERSTSTTTAAPCAALLPALRRLRRRAEPRRSTARCARSLAFLITLGVCARDVGRLHRGHRRHVHDRLADGADDDPRHGHGDARSTCTRASSSGPRTAPSTSTRSSRSRTSSLACTASIFATAVGFAALAVVRHPADPRDGHLGRGRPLVHLGRRLHAVPGAAEASCSTPTAPSRRPAAGVVRPARRVAAALQLPLPLVPLVVGVARALRRSARVALFGLPGLVEPMRLLDRSGRVHQPRLEALPGHQGDLAAELPGLGVTEVWLKGKLGSVSEPEVLTGLDDFHRSPRGRPRRRLGGRPDHDPAHDALPRRRGRRLPRRTRTTLDAARRHPRGPRAARADAPQLRPDARARPDAPRGDHAARPSTRPSTGSRRASASAGRTPPRSTRRSRSSSLQIVGLAPLQAQDRARTSCRRWSRASCSRS